MSRADFQYKIGELEGKRTIFIVDDDLGSISVTNDAAGVLQDIRSVLLETDLPDYQILYRDSVGQWDTMIPRIVNDRLRMVDVIWLPGNRNDELDEKWLELKR